MKTNTDQVVLDTIKEALNGPLAENVAGWYMNDDSGYCYSVDKISTEDGKVFIGESIAEFVHEHDAMYLLKAPTLLNIMLLTLQDGVLDEDALSLIDEVQATIAESSLNQAENSAWVVEGPEDEIKYLMIDSTSGDRYVVSEALYGTDEENEFIEQVPVWMNFLLKKIQELPEAK